MEPKTKYKFIAVVVSPEEKQRIEKAAEIEGRSVSTFVRRHILKSIQDGAN